VFKKAIFISIILFAFLLTNNQFIPTNVVKAFKSQTIRKGATGDDVKELQSRLRYIGYFKGKVDGVFGWSTYWALRNFQSAFGLKVDGVASKQTIQKLEKVTKYTAKTSKPSRVSSSNVPEGYSKNDINLMANAVYGESRGEPFTGQVAVAAVILNRVESPIFPNSVAGVIYQPGAFTAVSDGQINLTPNETAKKAVIDAINGWDPTSGCIYYFNPDTATSKWIWGRPQELTIGHHIFCK
jgi:N-acetylmuramoyl-L-alanine amidase